MPELAPPVTSSPGIAPRRRWTRVIAPILFFVVPLVLGWLLALIAFGAFRWEVKEICEHTGSRREHASYPMGIRTQVVESPSTLARHLARHHADRLDYRWRSYSRVSRGWLGTSHANLSMPRGFFNLPEFCLDHFMATASDTQVLALYDLVRSGNEPAIEARFQDLMDSAVK